MAPTMGLRERYETIAERLRQRLVELGSRRVWRANSWYWVLKPDLAPGETITF
jgi:hypothetical protein